MLATLSASSVQLIIVIGTQSDMGRCFSEDCLIILDASDAGGYEESCLLSERSYITVIKQASSWKEQ